MACPLAAERIWTEKSQYHQAEQKYFEHLSKLLKGSTQFVPEMNDIIKEENVLAKSPTKRNRKNNKKENLPVPIEQPEQPSQPPIAPTMEDVVQPKIKSKKDKHNKTKQLSKQNTTDSIKSEDNKKEAEPIVSNEMPEKCPFKTSIENVKPKKQKKKDKKLPKEDVSVSEDLSIKLDVKQNNNTAKEAAVKPKETKDKKTKPDKKKTETNKDHLQCCKTVSMDGIAALASTPGKDVLDRISTLEKENATLRTAVENLKKTYLTIEDRIQQLESFQSLSIGEASTSKPPAPAPIPTKDSDDDDGVDLFGSESEGEDDVAAKIREQRLAEYAARKSKKPTLIAKSNVILDVKPWDDETDMKLMEAEVRKIKMDGLLWGAAKLVPLAFGIHKLQISTVVEDDKVSVDLVIEEIEKIEDYVQSVDVAAFNKI